MPKITPFLWFDGQAEEAANYYVSVFKNSRIVKVARFGDAGPGPKGAVMLVSFELDGQPFHALNGGPNFTFDEAVSFVIDCADQADVDYYWDTLIGDGGQPSACGWLKDKYGLSWQVTPRELIEAVSSDDPAVAHRAMTAMMQMTKIDLAKLREALAA